VSFTGKLAFTSVFFRLACEKELRCVSAFDGFVVLNKLLSKSLPHVTY